MDLLAQYGHLLNASRTELEDKRRRLLDGIAKLNEASSTLTAMRSQLNDLQPLLAEKTAATTTLLQQVTLCGMRVCLCVGGGGMTTSGGAGGHSILRLRIQAV